MASINQAELSSQILTELSETPYACTSLLPLSGGTANFVFRGTLANPDHKTIIIKHFTDFASCNHDFPLDVSRCIFEETILKSLHNFIHDVKTPQLYFHKNNTQVHEDFPNTTDLKSLIISDNLSQSVATSIGHALGSWARSFHTWASTQNLLQNEPMQKLKHSVTYDSFIEALERFPNVLGNHKKTLLDVKDLAATELQNPTVNWGIIHGDFWTGNVLVSNPLSQNSHLFIIDWELAQFGHRAHDLGQMIGDLYERRYFKNADAALWIIEGFTDSYGPLSDDMAFRTAIHAGVHLICWCNRGRPKDSQEQMEGIVRIGMNFVLKGWKKDKKWFEDTVLASLFQSI